MPPAARKTDPTAHGGMIAQGSPDTFIGNLPAARLLDRHVCPLHGPGPVTQTSFTVFINGVGAARMTDACTCIVPASGKGGGEHGKEKEGGVKAKIDGGADRQFKQVEKEKGTEEKEEKKEEESEEKKHKGWEPKVSVKVSKELFKKGNAEEKKGHFETNLYETSGKASAGADFTDIKNAKADAGVKVEAEYTAGKAQGQVGDTSKGSLAQGSGEVKVLTAKADAGAGGKFEMKDGKLESAYAEAGAGAGGSVVEGKLEGKTKAFKIPFLNWGVSLGGEVSGALLTAEAKAEGHAGYKDHKWSFGFGAKVGAALAGLGFKFNVSIEKLPPPVAPPEPPGIPGVAGIDPIVAGCFTVLIGGVPPPYVPGPPSVSMPKPAQVGGPTGMNLPPGANDPPTEKERELAQKPGTATAQMLARRKVALAFYKENALKYDPAIKGMRKYDLPAEQRELLSHLTGIDFTQPIEAGPPPAAPTELTQWHAPGRKGHYFAPGGTHPHALGIGTHCLHPQTKEKVPKIDDTYKVPPETKYLKTTASNKTDSWSVGGEDQKTKGGGTQYYMPDTSSIANQSGSP